MTVTVSHRTSLTNVRATQSADFFADCQRV
jgi:hypothetical protein